MTTAAKDAPLFLVGPARGGTTYMGDLLFEWFGYGMGPEGTFVHQFARRLGRYGDLSRGVNLASLVADVCECEMLRVARHEYPPEERFDVTPALVMEHLTERSFAGVVRSVFTVASLLQDKPRIGNKNPGFWRCLPLLEELFPGEARYLFFIRDGRDVALALYQQPWGENTAYSAARTWARCVDAIERFSMRIEPERRCLVRYESLLQHPEEQIHQIADFLEMTPDLLDRASLVASIMTNPLRRNFGKWRTRMTPDEKRIFEAVAGPQLDDHGYELICPTPFVRAHERAYCACEELTRRVRLTLRGVLGR